jgi:hypothetical protein
MFEHQILFSHLIYPYSLALHHGHSAFVKGPKGCGHDSATLAECWDQCYSELVTVPSCLPSGERVHVHLPGQKWHHQGKRQDHLSRLQLWQVTSVAKNESVYRSTHSDSNLNCSEGCLSKYQIHLEQVKRLKSSGVSSTTSGVLGPAVSIIIHYNSHVLTAALISKKFSMHPTFTDYLWIPNSTWMSISQPDETQTTSHEMSQLTIVELRFHWVIWSDSCRVSRGRPERCSDSFSPVHVLRKTPNAHSTPTGQPSIRLHLFSIVE